MKKIILILCFILNTFLSFAQCNDLENNVYLYSDDNSKISFINLCEDSIDFLVVKQYNSNTEDYLISKNRPLYIEGDNKLRIRLNLYKADYFTTDNNVKECYYYYPISKVALTQIMNNQIYNIIIYYDYRIIWNDIDFKKSIDLYYMSERYFKYKKWKLP